MFLFFRKGNRTPTPTWRTQSFTHGDMRIQSINTLAVTHGNLTCRLRLCKTFNNVGNHSYERTDWEQTAQPIHNSNRVVTHIGFTSLIRKLKSPFTRMFHKATRLMTFRCANKQNNLLIHALVNAAGRVVLRLSASTKTKGHAQPSTDNNNPCGSIPGR